MSLLKDAERGGRLAALRAAGRLWPAAPVEPREFASRAADGRIRKLLLVGPHQRLGHFLCATPLLRMLNAQAPGVSLHFLGNQVSRWAAESNPRLSRVWVWPKGLAAAGVLRRLRGERFDAALLLTTEMPSTGGLLAARASAPLVAGYTPTSAGAEGVSALIHCAVGPVAATHEVEKYLQLGRALGFSGGDGRLELTVKEEDRAEAEGFLARSGAHGRRPRIGLFLGGKRSQSQRLWPAERFTELARRLSEAGASVIAIAPPAAGVGTQAGEDAGVGAFREALGARAPVFQSGALGPVAALLATFDLFICPDGGILHLAAAVDCPTLGLFFSTDPRVWAHDVPGSAALSASSGDALSVDEAARRALQLVEAKR